MRDLFLIDPSLIYLNHGALGACPRTVFESYQKWQLELEMLPTQGYHLRVEELLGEARGIVGSYLGTSADNLIFTPNATTGNNIIARFLKLNPGDEILSIDHEYGATQKLWQFICQKTGAVYVRHAVPLPVGTPDEFVESFWSAVTPRTKVISLSHITSATALRFPVEAVCQRAREAGILTLIDGAHVPGHIPLNLDALGADFYTGNFHKWLCAPKGTAFLYVRPEHHVTFEPLVIGWGWSEDASLSLKNSYNGTQNVAAYLSVLDAIRFQADNDWDAARDRCHELVRLARRRMTEITGLEAVSPDSREWFGQMGILPIPACEGAALKQRLHDEYRIEIPYTHWNDGHYLRVSAQAYTTAEEIEVLVKAVEALLPEIQKKD